MRCSCCSSPGPFREFTAREMKLGTRDVFTYRECQSCRSLQITGTPANLRDYYLQAKPADQLAEKPSAVVRVAAWVQGLLGRTGRNGYLRQKYPFLHWARIGDVGKSQRILLVGHGSAVLLRQMWHWGYRNLSAVDRFAADDTARAGYAIRRAELDEMHGQYDLVVLHEALEHVANPAQLLTAARQHLQPGGRVVVHVPLAASRLAREYGPDWFNLDAPRHLVIPSGTGMTHLVEAAGMRVIHSEYTNRAHTQYYSDCYRRDVSFNEASTPSASSQPRTGSDSDGEMGTFVLVSGDPLNLPDPLYAGLELDPHQA